MNRVAPRLAGRKQLRGALTKLKTFISRREWEQRSYTRQKAGWLLQGYFPLRDDKVYQAGYLISADQVIPSRFKIPSLGE